MKTIAKVADVVSCLAHLIPKIKGRFWGIRKKLASASHYWVSAKCERPKELNTEA
jgi:hypothetical protein